MGVEKFTLTTLLSPSVLQMPVAPETVTAEVPVIIKSLPSGAIELHKIGSLNTSSKPVGAHPNLERLSIGVGVNGYTVTGSDCPVGILRPQLSNKLLPSVPVSMRMI